MLLNIKINFSTMNCMSWDWCSCCAVTLQFAQCLVTLIAATSIPKPELFNRKLCLVSQRRSFHAIHGHSYQLQPYLASAHDLVVPHAYLPLIDALPQYVILVESRDTQISPKQNRVITAIFNKLFSVWRDSSETRKLRQIRPCVMNVTWVTTSTWPRGTNSRLSYDKNVMLNLSTERALTRVSGCVTKSVPCGSSPFEIGKGNWA